MTATSQAVVDICLARAHSACERCLQVKPLDPHHRKQRSLGGWDSPANVVMVCRRCHDNIHAQRPGYGDYENGWLLRSWDDPQRVCIRMPRGWVRLLDSGDAMRLASIDPWVARPGGAL